MIGVKDLVMGVSEALGLEGELTLDVQIITERIIQNRISESSKAEQVIESMRIIKYFRQVRDEIEWDRVRNYLCSQGIG